MSCISSCRLKQTAPMFLYTKCCVCHSARGRKAMKVKTKARKRPAPHAYTDAQLTELRVSTTARKQATVLRLQNAIETLNTKKCAITVQNIYEESGLRYAVIYRNPEALALFRSNTAH